MEDCAAQHLATTSDTRLTAADSVTLETLFELAMAIGGSFDTQVMLKRTLDAFLQYLNCSSGAVYLERPHALSHTPAFALPPDPNRNPAISVATQLMPTSLSRENRQGFIASLPSQGATDDGSFYCVLPISNLGCMVLVRRAAEFPETLVKALTPLMLKLAEACRVCLHGEELAASQYSTELERNMLRALVEATPTIVFALDAEGRFVYSEGRGLSYIGRNPGEVVGLSIFDLYRDVPTILDNIKAALAGEHRAVTVEMNHRFWDATYAPVVDLEGTVTGVVGVVHDVTDRKHVVDTLEAVLNTVGEGIITLDQRGIIVMVNQELERVFGYSQNELLGRPIGDLMPDDFHATHGDHMQRYLDTQASSLFGQRIERVGRHKNGTTFPIEVCVNKMTTGDGILFTGSIRDISEQKEYDLLRDEFVSAVSHELRTPLASIMGWTETLLTGHPGPINDTQRRFLNIIYASSQRLNRLIEEILTVSRIQRGTLRLNSGNFYPGQLLSLLRDATTQLAERQGIRLHFADTWPADQSLVGDVQLLEQALSNLISNAIKFSTSESDVFVRSTMIDGAWRVEVEDHGIGIAAKDMPRLFQRFARGSNAKREHIQGTGLGLYVSKAIVDGHGGTIQLISQEGTGTTAWFEIPSRPSTYQYASGTLRE